MVSRRARASSVIRKGRRGCSGIFAGRGQCGAKLVELGEAEALGVFDDHDGGVGDVDADFHDGGGDENLRFVFAETLHDFFFFVAGEAAVQQAKL